MLLSQIMQYTANRWILLYVYIVFAAFSVFLVDFYCSHQWRSDNSCPFYIPSFSFVEMFKDFVRIKYETCDHMIFLFKIINYTLLAVTFLGSYYYVIFFEAYVSVIEVINFSIEILSPVFFYFNRAKSFSFVLLLYAIFILSIEIEAYIRSLKFVSNLFPVEEGPNFYVILIINMAVCMSLSRKHGFLLYFLPSLPIYLMLKISLDRLRSFSDLFFVILFFGGHLIAYMFVLEIYYLPKFCWSYAQIYMNKQA